MAGVEGWELLMALAGVCALATFIPCGADKYFAVKGRWRVPERTLLLCALLPGGPFGALAGMRLFRHKTRKASFLAINAGGCIVQLLLASLVVDGPTGG